MASKKYWLANEFTIEFAKIRNLILPKIFKYQVEQVAKIVDHWQECRACKLGFDISEYSGTFEEIFTHLANSQLENHICNGEYNVLRSRKRMEEVYIGC